MKLRHPRSRIIPEDTKLLLRASHEAAHTVAAWAQGVPVRGITVDPLVARVQDRGRAPPALAWHEWGTRLELARVHIAGPIQDQADLAALGLWRSEPARFDGDTPAFLLFAGLAAEKDWRLERTDLLIQRLTQDTRDMLRAHEAARMALAAAVLKRGTLEEADILAILGLYPEVDAETLTERVDALAAALRARGNTAGGRSL